MTIDVIGMWKGFWGIDSWDLLPCITSLRLLFGILSLITENKLLRRASTSFNALRCFLCKEGLYKFILSLADFTLASVNLLPYFDLTKYNSSALVAVSWILLPYGMVHWQGKLVLLGRVAPLATAASIRNSIPITWLQLPCNPATHVQ